MHLSRLITITATSLLGSTAVAACYGSSNERGTCNAAAEAICRRACECKKNGKCHVEEPGGGLWESQDYETYDKCMGFHQGIRCLFTDNEPRYHWCESDVEAVACDGSKSEWFVLPESCKSHREHDAGSD